MKINLANAKRLVNKVIVQAGNITINGVVEKDIHLRLRKAIFPRSFSDWLREAEREALVKIVKIGRTK